MIRESQQIGAHWGNGFTQPITAAMLVVDSGVSRMGLAITSGDDVSCLWLEDTQAAFPQVQSMQAEGRGNRRQELLRNETAIARFPPG
jgi:hypothetical protein